MKFTHRQAVGALIVVVLAAFLPVRENGFVSLDDKRNFLENPSFRGLGTPQLVWAWTTGHLGVYEPLGWMFLEAEYSAWGLTATGYHLASLAIYVLASLALYALAVVVLARTRPEVWRGNPGVVRACACLAVGLYAVHPLRAQVVAWASCQPYVVCGLFSVLTVVAYLRAQEDALRVHRGWLAGCLLLYLAALLSKAPAIMLPAVLLVLDVYPLGRLGPGRWLSLEARGVYREKVAFFALSFTFTALAVWARARAMTQVPAHDAEARVARACYNVVFYLIKTIDPTRISASYPLPLRMTLTEPRFFLSAVGVLAVTAILLAFRRRFPGALTAWIIYIIMLAPTSGLFATGGTYVAADRYSFMPMMSLAVLAGSVLCAILGGARISRTVALGVVVSLAGVLVALIARTRDECRTWHDSETLWRHMLAVSTEPNPFASTGLALVLAGDQARLGEAESLLDDALRTVPDDPAVHNAMTTVLVKRGRMAEAKAHAREALRLAPNNVHARVNLGNLLATAGDAAGAKAAYQAALRIDPNDANAHGNLGLLLTVEGKIDEAESHLAEALRLNPTLPQVRRTIAELRRRQDREGALRDQGHRNRD